MDELNKANNSALHSESTGSASVRRAVRPRRPVLRVVIVFSAVVLAGATATAWLSSKAVTISNELNSATRLISSLQEQVARDEVEAASMTVDQVRAHTTAAKDAADDPLWTLAASVPWLGANFSAVAEITRSADDVASLGLAPLMSAYESLDWNALIPTADGADIESLKAASPKVVSAAHAVSASSDRLEQINQDDLLPQVAEPLAQARHELKRVTGALSAAADVSRIAPFMLGSDAPRNYLLMIQNSAEVRASGGIPGALAILTLDKGKLTLGPQSSAGDVGVMSPIVSVDPAQQQIYSRRIGKFLQDVNLTPDFPTAASTAQTMWERKSGQRVSGVVSIDPVVLSYLLQATGPVSIDTPELKALSAEALPAELNHENVVQTLLSDVYSTIEQPQLQDAYFASVAQKIFIALSEGKSDAKGLLAALTRGTEEGRVLLWSDDAGEQSVIYNYRLGGAVAGPSMAPAQFGVYFNDGTGAKMDYYIKRTVQLLKICPQDGYEQVIVRVTSTNTAPQDAASSLPRYVTGAGEFGVPAGTVQTNVVAYGPVQAQVETVTLESQQVPFAPYLHANRPVGVYTVRLAPGETTTLDFTFGKIVQHAEPVLSVTPTIQSVTDVTRPTENIPCT